MSVAVSTIELLQRSDSMQHVGGLLLTEINHRVSNSLQFASSILLLRARRSTSKEVSAELGEVAKSIQAIAVLHRRLCHAPNMDAVNLDGYFQELCSEIGASTIGGAGAAFKFTSSGDRCTYVDSDTATQLGIIVTELLTNCAKHAGESPICSLGLRVESNEIKLTVSDNGPGPRAPPSSTYLHKSGGVGLELVQGLVSQLKANMETVASETGVHVLITLPVAQ